MYMCNKYAGSQNRIRLNDKLNIKTTKCIVLKGKINGQIHHNYHKIKGQNAIPITTKLKKTVF